MAKVPLRKYNSEIESLIDRGQTDEAIAHCRHILKTFPKHLETYRLLGKAYLETKRYAEATDIFKRVLTAVPDDFVSHVGMSIIADDQKRLDDAIWHMERAFESQPSNAAIQSELQRLYGRRDGMEPPKIRLTRGALAHMYVQGELYAQAIGEIRSVLEEDPHRTDMQVLLALAYFRGGQRVEASEVCTQLIGRFPYSLDANRVLMEILPGTSLAESIQTYRQRVMELDPYTAHTAGSIFLANEAQDSAVTLDRLEYKGQPAESGEWGQALGIGLGAGAASVAKPEPILPPSQPFDSASRSTPVGQDMPFETPRAGGFDFAQPKPEAAAPAAGGDAIPAWMRDAGWGDSTGAFDEAASSLDEATAADDLPKADLPDWIKSMAPAETQTPPIPPSNTSINDDTMEWLNKLGGDKPFDAAQDKPFDFVQEQPLDFASQNTPVAEVKPAADQPQETPDWFSNLGNDDQPFNATAQEVPASAIPAPASPDSSIGDLGTSAAEQDAAMLWLEGLAAKQGAKSEELITNPAERMEKPPEWVEQAKAAGESQPAAPMFETTSSDSDELAKWLSKLDKEEKPFAEPAPETPLAVAPPVEPVAAPASLDSSIGDLGTSASDQDAAMLWLEGLAAKQGAKSEELITNPAERMEKPPEWVEQAKAAGESQPAAPVPESTSPDSDEFSDWLSKLDEEKPLELAQETLPVVTPPVEPVAAPASPDSSIGDLGTSAAEQDAAMLWLEGLAAKQGAKSEELITNPAERMEKPPEWVEQAKAAGESQPADFEPSAADQTGVWLRELDEKDERAEASAEAQQPAWSGEIEFTPSPPASPAERSAVEADLPTWLRGLEEREAASASPISDEMPEWLRGDEREVPAPPEPTRPADWTPEPLKVVASPAEPEPRPEPRIPEPRIKEVRKTQPKPEAPPPPDKTKVRRTGMLPPLIDPNLALARDAMSHGKIPDALHAYGSLIRKGKLLEDVTFDMKEALYRFPVEVSIWQALGDAYMRANRLQDALDAYTKAEELLR